MEKVMEKAAAKLGGKPAKTRKVTGMNIDKLDDGSYYVEHRTEGGEPTTGRNPRFSHKDLDSLKKHLDQHWQDEKGASDKTPKLPTSPEKPEADVVPPVDAK